MSSAFRRAEYPPDRSYPSIHTGASSPHRAVRTGSNTATVASEAGQAARRLLEVTRHVAAGGLRHVAGADRIDQLDDTALVDAVVVREVDLDDRRCVARAQALLLVQREQPVLGDGLAARP